MAKDEKPPVLATPITDETGTNEAAQAAAQGPADTDEHPSYPGLTYGEVAGAKKRAAATVDEARKDELLARIEEDEERQLLDGMGETIRYQREVANLTPVNRELVDITLSLAPQMLDIRIDGAIYRNREKHTVTRAKATEMLRIQFEGWQHESTRLGQDQYAFYSQMSQQARSIETRSGLRSSVVINSAGSIIAGAAPRGTHG